MIALLAAVLLAPQGAEVTAIQLPPDVVLTDVLVVDADGDGRDDLVLACRDGTRRELRLHLRRSDGPPFATTPSVPPYPLETDVVAFTFADTTPAPGRELVLLTPERAVAVERGDDGAPSYTPLCTLRLVWPAAAAEFALPLPEARVDVDGDGREDLLLPQPEGALLWRAERAPTPFALPPRQSPLAGRARGPNGNGGPASLSRDELQLRLPFGGDDGPRGLTGPLLRVRTEAPPCRVGDLDGDGRLDLAALRNDALHVFLQRPEGTFAAAAWPLPLPEDRLSLFDPAFDVQTDDLDGDGRADLLLTTSARRGDEVEVRVDTFLGREHGGFADAATGRLRVQALARPPQLVDVDGDGARDLVLVTVRVDMLRRLTGDGPTALEAQLLVFRNAGGRFAQPAMLQRLLRLPTGANGRNATFVQIVDGALFAFAEDTLERRPLARDGDRLDLASPTARFALPDGARVEGTIHDGEVLVRTEHELLVVRLR